MDIMEGIGTGAEGEPKITVRELMRFVENNLRVDVRDFGKPNRSDYCRGMDTGGIIAIWNFLFRFAFISSEDYCHFDINACFDDSGVISH